eukprot:scaffold82791_cov49-Attheya_sp.AAC.3
MQWCHHHGKNSPVLPSVIIILGIPGMRVVRCFFDIGIGCRSWNSGDDRLTLNVTRIGIIYRSALFTHAGGSMLVVGRYEIKSSPSTILLRSRPGGG